VSGTARGRRRGAHGPSPVVGPARRPASVTPALYRLTGDGGADPPHGPTPGARHHARARRRRRRSRPGRRGGSALRPEDRLTGSAAAAPDRRPRSATCEQEGGGDHHPRSETGEQGRRGARPDRPQPDRGEARQPERADQRAAGVRHRLGVPPARATRVRMAGTARKTSPTLGPKLSPMSAATTENAAPKANRTGATTGVRGRLLRSDRDRLWARPAHRRSTNAATAAGPGPAGHASPEPPGAPRRRRVEAAAGEAVDGSGDHAGAGVPAARSPGPAR